MKRLRWLLVVLFLLLVMVGGVAAWQYVYRGYPNVVYYQVVTVRVRMQTNKFGLTRHYEGTILVRRWTDCQGQRRLTRSSPSMLILGHGVMRMAQGSLLERNGKVYALAIGQILPPVIARPGSTPSPLSILGYSALEPECQLLQRAGFAGLATALLGHARGPIMRVQYAGHSALRFSVPHEGVFWVDAGTHMVMAEQLFTPPAPSDVWTFTQTARYVTQERLASYTLPTTFFDPPHTHRTLWERISGWLQAHLPHR